MLSRLLPAVRLGGGAGGALPGAADAVNESLRGKLTREALDGVRLAEEPRCDGSRLGGGVGMTFATDAFGEGGAIAGGVSTACDCAACALREGGGGGASAFKGAWLSGEAVASMACAELLERFESLRARPPVDSGCARRRAVGGGGGAFFI